MFKLPKKAATAQKVYLTPGPYESTVVSVEPAPGYAKGQAVKVTYDLVDSAGNHFPYYETFRTVDPLGDHSNTFFDYLDKNGISKWEDLVGCQEVLTLQYEFVGSRKYLNVDQSTRQFVYEDEDGGCDAEAE